MNFDLSDDQRLLEETVDHFLGTECPMTRVRELFDGEEGYDDRVWQGLGEMGILGLHLPEELGGAGLEMLELSLVAEAMGRHATPGPFFEHALAGMAIDLGGSEAQREQWLPKLATGELRASFAIAERGDESGTEGAWRPEQWRLGDESTLTGEKQFAPHADGADLLVIGLRGGGFGLVESGAPGLATVRVESLDRTRRLDSVLFDQTPCDRLPKGAEVASQVLDAGLVLLAADAYGGGMACIDASVEYAKTREQFGVKIGSFQALKHQLADMAVEIHPTRGLVWFAAHAFDHLPEEAAAAAANAKAHLTDRFVDVARDTVEAHGGIGYTWECDVQFWFKRSLFDWAMLGDPNLHRRRTADLMGW
ncbi:MAG: acyl-CoA/acyl-ACP dehydrogenase [bacterium]|nr:acyl-CoA dehydrogenase [Deltaproteobacteria bacterium]MCP4906172.1 acyl-CoA/acyl-ACP dehydrogenase [bacterium]